nr:MAG TPA: immunity protein [Bacteriophage sp.]
MYTLTGNRRYYRNIIFNLLKKYTSYSGSSK